MESVPTLLVVPDGVADWKQPDLDDRTPLEAARTPNLDRIKQRGRLYRLENIPPECPADSGIANISMLGYDPRDHYLGRGPMEALNLGINLRKGQIAYRCNLVSVDGDDTLTDYSASNIPTEVAHEIFGRLNDAFEDRGVRFVPGIRYRGVLVVEGDEPADCYPPHDEMGRSIQDLWPRGSGAEVLTRLMRDSRSLLDSIELPPSLSEEAAKNATMIWPWGGGAMQPIPSVQERYRRSGHVVAGVDLINGLGVAVGLTKEELPGATGDFQTDMAAKARRALEVLEDVDVDVLHLEATDEAGHEGDPHLKVEMIEKFDRDMLSPILEAGPGEEFELLVGPDHFTPIQKRTHVGDPVPLLVVDGKGADQFSYTEQAAEEAPLISDGWDALAGWYARENDPFGNQG